jgi:hypothetical protein
MGNSTIFAASDGKIGPVDASNLYEKPAIPEVLSGTINPISDQ